MVGGQAIDLQAAGQAPGHALTLDADGLRAHARAQDRRADPRLGGQRRDHGGRHATTSSWRSTGTPPRSAWRFRSSTTFSTSRAIRRRSGRPPGKDAAGAKPTYPSIFGLDRSRALAAECLERAYVALSAAGLSDGWLGPIAEWVVSRKS